MNPLLIGAGVSLLVGYYTGALGHVASAAGVGPARPLPLGSYRVTSRALVPRWRDPHTELPVPAGTPGALLSTHSGTDLGAPLGTPVYACEAGVVSQLYTLHAKNGNAVFIRTAAGEQWCYLHLNSYNVQRGQAVARGEQIGVVGSTGLSNGPHLHLQLYDAHMALVDPETRFPGGLG